MNTLSPTDVSFVVRRLPKDLTDLMREQRLFVGGGFIRETIAGAVPKDIDLFAGDKESLSLMAKLLATKRQARLHETDNAITLLAPPRMPLQFITRWCFNEPEPLIASFDFTVCQAAIWYEKATGTFASACAEGFYADLAARRLVYTFPRREEEAGGSMMRVRKFLQRGYTIQADSLAGVIARVAKKVRWGEVGDDEMHAAKVIAGLLYEVDPLLVVDGLEPVNEHEAPAA